ncbi:disease resistance protein RGA4-like [Oryza brachyantha]|uniref:disease resistance protein RGA4-like n=1 Tax=Oryza brachyantha TaxID=4533 RepID=UPI001ADADB0B|nr:disease resistance protein RGA4-like [Oryza brachyantha]
MEAALLSGLIRVAVPKLMSTASDRYKLHRGLKDDMSFLATELKMIGAAIDRELSSPSGGDHGAVLQLSMEELRKLAHDIEDCIDEILYRATREQQSSAVVRTLRSSIKKLHDDPKLGRRMQRLREKVEQANRRSERYRVAAARPSSPATAAAAAVAEQSSDPRNIHVSLVGVEAPQAELRQQLAEARKLRVISVVGFSGSGKTALAAEVYNHEREENCMFDKFAWACAARKDPGEVLSELLRGVGADDRSSKATTDVGQLCVDLRQQLEKKRYLIVIDDIRTEALWKAIEPAFPAHKGVRSRIIVTTTIQSVANCVCGFSDGYVLEISRLNDHYSKQLLCKKACPDQYANYDQPDTTAILKQCDGQPLALVTVGEFLRANGWPVGPDCDRISNGLQYYLRKETFERMRRMMMSSYATLPGHALKACLLYLCVFPSDHPVRRKSLLRRWLAEGFVEAEPQSLDSALFDPADAFHELINRKIIRPINVSNNCSVRTCKTYGMMHGFLLGMATSQNFVTLFSDQKPEPRYARRLSVHGGTVLHGDDSKGINLSLIRSLTIFGEASESVLDLSKYQLLRVLDLEKCDNLKNGHLQDVCNLLLLKYMSLGGEVTRIPSDIGKLEYLEVLDLRRTKVDVVPVQVFQLPSLIHLFGKFKLQPPDESKQATEVLQFLSKDKSKLETLAGFVTDGSEGFLHLLGFMKKLRKVEIWCKSSAGSTDAPVQQKRRTGVRTDLRTAIEKFILDDMVANPGRRTLSLHFDERSEEFLKSLTGSFYLSSLKLQGNFTKLPKFVLSVRGLVELCISSGTLTTRLLEALSTLVRLKYLKLIADELQNFIIRKTSFPSLVRLCIAVENPTFPSIEEGALEYLVALQVLCKKLKGLSDIKIEKLLNLQEVTLDAMVSTETKELWKKATKEHPRRPKMLLLNSLDTSEYELTHYCSASGHGEIVETESSHASGRPVQEMNIQKPLNQGLESSYVLKKQNNCAGQSSPNQLSSDTYLYT